MMPAAVSPPGSTWADSIQYAIMGLSSPPAGLPDVEGFDFTPGPARIATESLRNLTQVWGAAVAAVSELPR